MVYKIRLKEEPKKMLEYLRGAKGQFCSEVFFWDVIFREEFDSKERALDFARIKINALDLEDIKIIKIGEDKEQPTGLNTIVSLKV